LLIRTLVLDITVYVGKLALNAYDRDHADPWKRMLSSLEETLEDLSHVQVPPAMEADPVILEIRRELVGFSTVMLSNPTWEKWKAAVRKAADHIARNYFPDSDSLWKRPLSARCFIGHVPGWTRWERERRLPSLNMHTARAWKPCFKPGMSAT
jgi:hypothetical protein